MSTEPNGFRTFESVGEQARALCFEHPERRPSLTIYMDTRWRVLYSLKCRVYKKTALPFC